MIGWETVCPPWSDSQALRLEGHQACDPSSTSSLCVPVSVVGGHRVTLWCVGVCRHFPSTILMRYALATGSKWQHPPPSPPPSPGMGLTGAVCGRSHSRTQLGCQLAPVCRLSSAEAWLGFGSGLVLAITCCGSASPRVFMCP